MQHNRAQREVSECPVCCQRGLRHLDCNSPLWGDIFEFVLVFGVNLRPQRRGQNELADGARETVDLVSLLRNKGLYVFTQPRKR